MRLRSGHERPSIVMTIHKHFVILSATSVVPANDNERRIVRHANLEPFKRVRRPRPS